MDRLEQHFNREKATREDVTCALLTYLLWRLPRAAPQNHQLCVSLCPDVSFLPALAHSAGQMWLSVSPTRASLYQWKERTGDKYPGSPSLERQLSIVFHMLPESHQHDWTSACNSNGLLRQSSLLHFFLSITALYGVPPKESSSSLVSGETKTNTNQKKFWVKGSDKWLLRPWIDSFCVK